jgi:hypothetical protein
MNTREQQDALAKLRDALKDCTAVDAFDAADMHPDVVNAFCDELPL